MCYLHFIVMFIIQSTFCCVQFLQEVKITLEGIIIQVKLYRDFFLCSARLVNV